jgi:hypothetical protein
VDKRCWSATFDSGPTRFTKKRIQDREIYERGKATARSLGLSRDDESPYGNPCRDAQSDGQARQL